MAARGMFPHPGPLHGLGDAPAARRLGGRVAQPPLALHQWRRLAAASAAAMVAAMAAGSTSGLGQRRSCRRCGEARRRSVRVRRLANASAGPPADSEEAGATGSDAPVAVALRAALPFVLDPGLLSEDVVYEGPLETIQGRSEYLAAMRNWSARLPERLEGFRVTGVDAWALQPGEVVCRWSCQFVAPLPPTARLRGLPAGMIVLPGNCIAVEAQLRASLELDADGRVVRHVEEVASGYGMADTVARYELLTARRPDTENPVAWYWRVLRATTLEELSARSGGRAKQGELEWRFYEMVLRNFAAGALLGVVIYACYRALNAGG